MGSKHDLEYFVRVDDAQLKGLRVEAGKVAKALGLAGPASVKGNALAGAAIAGTTKKAQESAAVQIAAQARIRKGLLAQLEVYRAVAHTATAGSAEQVAAVNLADRAMRRLGIDGEVAGVRVGRGAHSAERQLGRLTRGALSASGILKGIGRGAIFGGFAFIGGATVLGFLRKVVEDSQNADRSQKALDTQLQASGISADKYGGQIEKVVRAQSKLAAVNDKEVTKSLTILIRATGDLNEAYALNALALDLAAAKGIAVTDAARVFAKVATGNVGVLRRQGIAIAKNATVTEALREAQQQLGGQAVAAGRTAGGAFERFDNALERTREKLGEGILPVFTRDLNELAAKLDDPEVQAKVRAFGERISRGVDGAIHDVVDFMREHWPEVKRDFDEGKTVVEELAKAVDELAKGLDKLGSIVPGDGSILKLLFEGALIRKFAGIGKPAAAAAEKGGGSALLESSFLASLFGKVPGSAKVKASVPEILKGGGRLARLTRLGTLTIAVDLALSKHDRQAVTDKTLGPGSVGEDIKHTFHAPDKGFLGQFLPDSIAYPFGIGKPSQEKIKNDVAKAIADGGEKGAESAGQKLEMKITESARQAAENLRDRLVESTGTAFSKLTDKALEGFDGVTDAILSKFDRATDAILSRFDEKTKKLEQQLVVTVKLPRLDETFRIRVDGKTPAERELDALDKVEAKRHAQRDLRDDSRALAEAIAIGDPRAIEEAKAKVHDDQDELRRQKLERRAQLERAAADKALARGTERLDTRRAKERQALQDSRDLLRKDLAARRALERENFQATLVALGKEIAAGKIKAGAAQKAILAVLAKYGVNYRSAGTALGKAFATGLGSAVNKAARSAERLHTAIDKLTRLKKKIEDLKKPFEDIAKSLEPLNRLLTVLGGQPQTAFGGKPRSPSAAPPPKTPAQLAAHKKERAGLPTRKAILNALKHYPHAYSEHKDEVPLAGEPTLLAYQRFLSHLAPPVASGVRKRLHKAGFFRARRGGVAPGDGRPDTTLALLTRGELVLTDADQRKLAQRLGISGGPHALLTGIRGLPRYAGGGVVDGNMSLDDLTRLLVERLAQNEVKRDQIQTRSGGRRHGPGPIHIEQQFEKDPRLRNLPPAKKAALEQRLAQLQAHPALYGLVTPHDPGAETLGPAGKSGRPLRRRDAINDIPSGAFGGGLVVHWDGDIIINGVRDEKKAAAEVRKQLVRKANRNGRRTGRRTTLGDKVPR